MGTRGKPGGPWSREEAEADRRRQPRGSEAPTYLIGPIPGVVTDLGPGGFCVETWEPLAVNRRYVMLIGETGERSVRLACRVEWCRMVRAEKGDNGDVVSIYRLGVSYLGFEERQSPRE